MAKKILFAAGLLAAFAWSLPTGLAALELSLEENRGESGTVGYVDMDRVFREYSGTLGARDEFLGQIKRKEAELAGVKTGIFALKAEISRLRQEREFAAALPLFFGEDPAQTSSATAVGASPDAAAAAGEISTATLSVDLSSAAAAAAGEVSTTTAFAPPAAVPPAAARTPLINMPGVGAIALDKFRMSVSTSVADIDAAIAAKEKQLGETEEILRAGQRRAEKELLAQESRKTEAILGRIYFLLRELAVAEGVSVIIDKRSILFGHAAVDLTEKLIIKLEENGGDK